MIEFRSNSEQDYQVDSERITTYKRLNLTPMGGWFCFTTSKAAMMNFKN